MKYERVSPEKKGVQVRIWQIPLRQPSRQGPLNQPGPAQCLPQSPCQPSRLKESKPASVSCLYSISCVIHFCRAVTLTGPYLSSKPYRWASPDPGPACSPARSLEAFGCTSGLSHIPVGRKTQDRDFICVFKCKCCQNCKCAMTLDVVSTGSYLESVVGHCKVEQEVPGIILGCFMNKFYTENK